jgi:uncharacterized protein (DUF2235 family)
MPMVIEWASKAIDAICAFFVSSQFFLLLGSIAATYFLSRLLMGTVHRPWRSSYWRAYPVATFLIVAAIIFIFWHGEPGWILSLAVAFSLFGAVSMLLRIGGRALRAKAIVVATPKGMAQRFEVAETPLGPPPDPVSTSRRIVIFCDGTSNRPDQLSDGVPAPTNVCRLYDDLVKDESQVGWYDPGVGTETSSRAVAGATAGRIAATVGIAQASEAMGWYVKIRTIIETAFGVGITENIVQAYSEIVRQYRPGDRIYLIGFSRGAYTARCVAGVIRRCGLLRSENIRYAADVVRLYGARGKTDHDVPIRPELRHERLPAVEFLGLFDTVGSLGVPMWGWWFNWRLFFRNRPLSTDPSPICVHVYHALAMDERRAQFFPTPFDGMSPGWTRTLEQVWFRGGHCDIGGGYADAGLSDIALEWMLGACVKHGLAFKGRIKETLRPDPLARMHDELQRQPAWRLLGSWPRWHPVDQPLHPSVLVRADAIRGLGRHDMHPVGLEPIEFEAQAQREWDRTGLILEGNGAHYRLTWNGGMKWRDKDCPSCGPEGQAGNDPTRLLSRFRRRLPRQPYMTLCLTIAHPRTWQLRERGLNSLLKFLLVHDPEEMREQVAPVGGDLAKPGASIVIRNDGPAGLLYVFANDLWMTAANNSGALDLTIRRLPEGAPADEPLWTSTGRRDRRNGQAWHWVRTPPP